MIKKDFIVDINGLKKYRYVGIFKVYSYVPEDLDIIWTHPFLRKE